MTNGPVEQVLVHRDAYGLPDRDVYARVVSDVVVVLTQGDDHVAVPLDEFGRFVDNLERIYTGQEPVIEEPAR